jgi:hypothetical protein
MDRRAETDSGEGRRDQLGAGVPEANVNSIWKLLCSL